MAIFGQGLILREFPGLQFGNSECDAYCGRVVNTFTAFAFESQFANITQLFADPSASIPAPAGWYSNGSQTLQVDQAGVYVTGGTGSGCVCTSTLTAIAVVASEDSCSGCCETVYGATAYGNASSLPNCTVLWADVNGTTPLVPNYYYKNNDGQVQVGDNGSTIIEYIGCTGAAGGGTGGCNCLALENKGTYAYSISWNGYYATADDACNNIGLEGYRTFYQDASTFASSTLFYYDINEENPIGASGATGYVSNGLNVFYFNGATATSAGLCTSFAEEGRVVGITTTVESLVPIGYTCQVEYLTCPDPFTFFIYADETYGGTGWVDSKTLNYNSNYFVAFAMTPDIDSEVNFQYTENGIVIDNRTVNLPANERTVIQTSDIIGDETISFSLVFAAPQLT